MIDVNTQAMLLRDALLCGDDSEQNVGQRAQIDSALNNVHTCCPGVVDSFNPSTMTVEVVPALRKLYFPDGEAGVWMDLPMLVDVPVVVLSGGGFAITFPIQQGDECLLLFSERAIDNWHESGNVSELAHARAHSLSDAFALVGVRSKPNVVTNYNTEELEIRSKDGQTRVRMNAAGWIHLEQGTDHIDLGGGEIGMTATTIRLNGQVVVSGDVTEGEVSLKHHVHSGVQSGGGTSGPPV